MAKRIHRLFGLVVGLALLLKAGAAFAAFHLVVIEEVFFGTESCPDAQYVKLRTISIGQIFVAGQPIETKLADGSAAPDFGRFTTTLSNGANDVAMIIGTAQAAGLFGMTFDQVVTGRLVQPDGKVCYGIIRIPAPAKPVDCVAYGNFTGDNTGYGTPTVAPVLGMALVRRSETDNNANDFVLGPPMPENNHGDVGTLGECPAEPTPTATVEPTPTSTMGVEACTGDCNRDLAVTVDEIVHGVNIALGNSPVSGCLPFDADASGTVTVDEIVVAVNNALNGCGT